MPLRVPCGACPRNVAALGQRRFRLRGPVAHDATALAGVVRDPVRFCHGLRRQDPWPLEEATRSRLLGHRSLHTTSVYLQHIAPAAAVAEATAKTAHLAVEP